jgi:hypothetical protein
MGAVRINRYRAEQNDLPPVCMRCGAAATTTHNKTFSRPQEWTSGLFLLGGLPYFLATWLFRNRVRFAVPLCEDHRNHFRWESGIFWGGILSLIAAFVAILMYVPVQSGLLEIGLEVIGILAAGWLLVVIVSFFRGTCAAIIDEEGVVLGGVANKFVKAYEASERAGQTLPPELDNCTVSWSEAQAGRREHTLPVEADRDTYRNQPRSVRWPERS